MCCRLENVEQATHHKNVFIDARNFCNSLYSVKFFVCQYKSSRLCPNLQGRYLQAPTNAIIMKSGWKIKITVRQFVCRNGQYKYCSLKCQTTSAAWVSDFYSISWLFRVSEGGLLHPWLHPCPTSLYDQCPLCILLQPTVYNAPRWKSICYGIWMNVNLYRNKPRTTLWCIRCLIQYRPTRLDVDYQFQPSISFSDR